MKYKGLVLHAWHHGPRDNWYPWLGSALRKRGYDVSIPKLPTMDTDLPDLTRMLALFEKDEKLSSESVVFGHSLGALLAMRLAESRRLGRLFLVSGWDFDDLTQEHRLFWKTPINHAKIRKNVGRIYCVTSDNDPYTTAFTVRQMTERLKGVYILIRGKGHFTAKDGVVKLPEVIGHI